MSDDERTDVNVGAIEWCDLTVEDAEQTRDFYCRVVDWESSPVSMGEYDDFNIMPSGTGDTVAGICHARGGNAGLPAQWLIYVRVKDVAESAARCTALGGSVLDGPRTLGSGQMCVIRDPQGACLALVSG